MLEITSIQVEGLEKNCITDNPAPSFSCVLKSTRQNTNVEHCRFIIACKNEIVWDSGENNKQTVNVKYAGKPLEAFTEYTIKVTVQDTHGNIATGEMQFETGRMGTGWNAEWITDAGYHFLLRSPKPMLFRKAFGVNAGVQSVKLYSTALGVYELNLNGKKVGDDYFRPGYTSYPSLLQYQVYDITHQVKKNNTLFATVAGGWAVGDYTMMHRKKIYAKRQALLLEIRIAYADGRTEILGTDSTWDVSEKSNWRYADFYNGEIYDARINIEKTRYKKADVTVPDVTPQLLTEYGVPVRKQEQLTPVRSWKSRHGGTIYDFGQNFAGVISAKINGVDGQKIVFKHAEVCVDDELFTKPLRFAKARLIYTCKNGQQEYTPQFTYMGFRYVWVKGIAPDNIELSAFALYSEIKTTGSFECSDKNINRLQQNIVWGGKSNFVEIPTDCPQRDERMGWTGDIAVFARTAAFNFDMRRFLDKWLLDLLAEQGEDGGIPDVIPSAKYGKPRTTECWADSCVLVPWALYLAYGDKALLRRQYASMVKHVNAELRLAASDTQDDGEQRYIWRKGFHYGDWCAPGETRKQWQSKAPWTATAYMANSCMLLSHIAKELEEEADARKYAQIAEKISHAYSSVHTDGNGKLHNEFQTAYVLPLYFGMVKDADAKKMAANLARLVQDADTHLTTGFCGTPYLLFALSDNGYLDKAYELLMQKTNPSWLYAVTKGGTTIWERWDAVQADGKINNRSNMVSFNHYAYGAVGDWLYRRVAGIEMAAPAYRQFSINPQPGGGLTWAKAELDTVYGKIKSHWKISGGNFMLDVSVPVNTQCSVTLPDGTKKQLGSGEYTFEQTYS